MILFWSGFVCSTSRGGLSAADPGFPGPRFDLLFRPYRASMVLWRRAAERTMDPGVWADIDELRNLKTAALRAKYLEAFGLVTRSSNKQFLFRRIAWRLQARSEGDLSERARRRAAEIADEGDVRLRAPKGFVTGRVVDSPLATTRRQLPRDCRVPRAGTILTRQYHGQSVVVHVKDDGSARIANRFRPPPELLDRCISSSMVLCSHTKALHTRDHICEEVPHD